MNHRHLTSLAAAALLLASASVRAQTPTTPPADTTVPAQPGGAPANPPAAPAMPSALPTPPPSPPAPAPVMNTKWKASMYGFVEMDIIYDSTKSFTDASQNNTVVRPGTDAYDNGRLQFTPKNSRLGFNFAAPEYEGMKASAQIETDFFGPQPAVSEFNAYGQGLLRMRHFYLKLETPVIDVLAGQFHDLFAWGGGGFYPNALAFLSLPGQAYNRRPQLRLTKIIKSDAVNVEVAVSAARPFQRDSMTPDGMGGIKLVLNQWKGARAQGSGAASVAPLAIGVSGIVRKFNVNDPAAAGEYLTGTGWGAAANLFAPIIPASGDDMSNTVSLVAEFTTGAGIADMYNGLGGGARFPAAPNPMMVMPAPVYTPNIDGNVLTINNGELVPIKWTGVVVNLQYHFPINMGKTLWLSLNGSMLTSSNIEEAHSFVAEMARNTSIWKKKYYGDFNLFYAITPAVQISGSYQHIQQIWLDEEKSTNHRGELTFHYWF